MRIPIAVLSLLALATCAHAAYELIPKSAELINSPKIDGWDVGMVQLTFKDGKKEIADKSDKCALPQVSPLGNVGWSEWTDTQPGRYHHSYEILRVRTVDGKLHDFRPNAYFIKKWGFADHDKAVVIESMQHHGSSFYIKYDIASGKVLGRVDDYTPYAELPKWAQPFADKDE